MRKSSQNKPVEMITANQGWSQMSVLLDKEQPTSNSRPTILYWGLGLLCMISLGSILYWNSQVAEVPVSQPPQIKQTVPVKTPDNQSDKYNKEIAVNSDQTIRGATSNTVSTQNDSNQSPNTTYVNKSTKHPLASIQKASTFLTKDQEIPVNSTSDHSIAHQGQSDYTGILSNTTKAASSLNQDANNQTISLNNTIVNSDINNSKTSIIGNKSTILDHTTFNSYHLLSKRNLDKQKVSSSKPFGNNSIKQVAQSNLENIRNLNLSDLPNKEQAHQTDNIALSHFPKKDIELLDLKSEQLISALTKNEDKIEVPEVKLPKKRVNLGSFLASAYGFNKTISGRAGLSISTKVSNRMTVYVDPTYSHVRKLAQNISLNQDNLPNPDSSTISPSSGGNELGLSALVSGANQLTVPVYAMYRPLPALGVSLGMFAGGYNMTFNNVVSPTSMQEDTLDTLYKSLGGKRTGITYGAMAGLHYIMKSGLQVNLGFENSFKSFNQEGNFIDNSQISLGIGYTIL